jgi:hypothetical protein
MAATAAPVNWVLSSWNWAELNSYDFSWPPTSVFRQMCRHPSPILEQKQSRLIRTCNPDDIPAHATKKGLFPYFLRNRGVKNEKASFYRGTAIMMISEITEKEYHLVLLSDALARVGCAPNDQPYVVPLYCL